jgi:hypothetical protein
MGKFSPSLSLFRHCIPTATVRVYMARHILTPWSQVLLESQQLHSLTRHIHLINIKFNKND